MRQKNKAILTFDLDFWHSGMFSRKYLPQDKSHLEDFVQEPIDYLLPLLKKHGQKATFFVLGKIAEKYPQVIRQIDRGGHEIASHGYSHRPLFDLTPETLEKEIKRSKQVLEQITKKQVFGFRAPNFTLNSQTSWTIPILKKYFQYDSSIHPFCLKKINLQFKEVYPCLGGFYFRALPLPLYLLSLKYFSKFDLPVVFLHPYELIAHSPRIKSLPWLKYRIKYIGLRSSQFKFKKLLKQFKFISIKEYLYEGSTH